MEKITDTLRAAPGAAKDAVQHLTGSNAKINDLAQNTKDSSQSSFKMTSDYGASISDTDHWLKVVNPQNPNGHGPSLLEDQFAREKVRILYLFSYYTITNAIFDFLDSQI